MKGKVEETEKKCDGLVSTYDRHWISGEGADAVFDKERTELHEKIVSDYFKNNAGKNAVCGDDEEPSLILLGGRGGSGKSNFENLVYDKDKVIVIDSDKVKELIPEYDNWNASQVHEESSYLMKRIVERARDAHYNVVIDQTMSSEKQSLKYLDMFKGYHTEAHYMYLPPQESAIRGMKRFRDDGKKGKWTGRFVPAKVLMSMNKNEAVFDIVKNNVDNWSFYSNYGVNRGDKPILISKKR